MRDPSAFRVARREVLRGAVRLALVAGAGVAGLAGCSKSQPQFKATDITGASFGKKLELSDHNGKPRQLADFAGKVVVLFFGFTHCPDVCPNTLLEMKGVLEKLGDRARDVQVLFVTVDPERDAPDMLARYVTAFDPSFIGLRGTPEQTAAAAREFKVFFMKVPGSSPDTYSIDHTAASYVLDRSGELRLMISYNAGVDAMAHDIGLLLDQS